MLMLCMQKKYIYIYWIKYPVSNFIKQLNVMNFIRKKGDIQLKVKQIFMCVFFKF